MANLPVLGLRTHAQRVCSLYKAALRNLENYYHNRMSYRYHAVLMRARFDEHAREKDMRKAVQLLHAGREELFKTQHPIPRKFAHSPGGVAYAREQPPADWVLDYWHPLEKAQYPDYFRRREQRKKEFVEWWQKEYGEQDKPGSSAH